MIIASDLVDMFKDDAMFANVEAVKGYLNFKLSEDFLDEYATWALDNPEKFGKGIANKKILLEFVSANPTGPLSYWSRKRRSLWRYSSSFRSSFRSRY